MTFQLAVSMFAILALLLSAFLAALETALTAVSKPRIQRLVLDGSLRAKQSLKLIDDRERVAGTLLIARTFLNVLAIALATSVMLDVLPENGILVTTLAMTALILVFAEAVPRSLASGHSEYLALSAPGLLRVVVPVLNPISSALQRMTRGVSRPGRPVAAAPAPTAQDEIRGTI